MGKCVCLQLKYIYTFLNPKDYFQNYSFAAKHFEICLSDEI